MNKNTTTHNNVNAPAGFQVKSDVKAGFGGRLDARSARLSTSAFARSFDAGSFDVLVAAPA